MNKYKNISTVNAILPFVLLLLFASSCAATNPLVTDKVYLTISIDGDEVGKIVIGLFGEVVPKTVRNFVELATHANGYGYRGSEFIRVDKYYYVHGGAFKFGNKTEGTSIYGRYFEDESRELKHYGRGWVSMASAGKDRNGSQFVIVTHGFELFDRHNVVFGKVLQGMPIVRQMQSLEKSSGQRPTKPCFVSDSGIVPLDVPFRVPKDDAPYNDPPVMVTTSKTQHQEL